MYEVGEVKRLAEDEKADIESVAHFQFGVLCLFHDKLQVAEIAESLPT